MKTFEGCLGEHELLNGRKQRETLPVKIAMALIQYPINLINQDMSQKGRYYRDINPQVLEANSNTEVVLGVDSSRKSKTHRI